MSLTWIGNLIDKVTRPTDYPTAEYPTIVEGYVQGQQLRFESLDGSEMYWGPKTGFVTNSGTSFEFDGKGFRLKNFGPIVDGFKQWGVSHLQKGSDYGWLVVSPHCFHGWTFWKKQEQDASGLWLPGTEKGIYIRKPFSWRWDVAGTTIDGVLRHWIWTKGIVAAHWD